MSKKVRKIALWGIGLIAYSFVFEFLIMPPVMKMQLKKKASLKQGSQMRELWGKIPFALEYNFRFFNVTNPDEIKEGAKPILQEVGPFCYDQWQEKSNQVDHEEDDTVSFTFKNTYYFNETRSNGLTGNEEIIVPNLFILGLVNTMLREKPWVIPIVDKAINSIFKNPENIFIKVKVQDLLFNGLIIDCTVTDIAGTAVCQGIRDHREEFGLPMIEDDVYLLSLFGTRNGTDENDVFRVRRGLENLMDLGKVVEYKGKPNMSTWNDDYCDEFRGTDGTVFHAFFDPSGRDELVAFNAGLCRNLNFHFDSMSEVSGLDTLRYTTSFGVDPEGDPKDKCFCEAPDECLKKGVFDAYECLSQPIVFSNPHFYLADSYYLDTVEGLEPNKKKHMTILDVQATFGAPLYARSGVQVNFFIRPVAKFKLMKSFPEALLPIFWIEVRASLPDYLLVEIKDGVRQMFITTLIKNLMTIGGIGLCCWAAYLYYKVKIQGGVKMAEITKPDKKKPTNAVIDEKSLNVISLRSKPPLGMF